MSINHGASMVNFAAGRLIPRLPAKAGAESPITSLRAPVVTTDYQHIGPALTDMPCGEASSVFKIV
jgi:hypothetical protein